MSTLQIPPLGVPAIDGGGQVTPFWRKFFNGILERVGGYNGDILAGLAQLDATGGLVVQTDSAEFTKRTLTAGTGISMSNGDGVGGNPTVAIANTGVVAGTYASPTSITVNARGQITAIS